VLNASSLQSLVALNASLLHSYNFSTLNASSPLLFMEKHCLTFHRFKRNSSLKASSPLLFTVILPTSECSIAFPLPYLCTLLTTAFLSHFLINPSLTPCHHAALLAHCSFASLSYITLVSLLPLIISIIKNSFVNKNLLGLIKDNSRVIFS
jgi:hypothetical protein